MMSKHRTVILSILLSAVIICSLAIVAFAAEGENWESQDSDTSLTTLSEETSAPDVPSESETATTESSVVTATDSAVESATESAVETATTPAVVETAVKEQTLEGDVDGDGQVTIADARLIARAAKGLEVLDETQADKADQDGNGSLSKADAIDVMEEAAGLDNQ